MTAPTVTLQDVARGLDGSRLMTLDQCEAGAALVRAAVEVVEGAHIFWKYPSFTNWERVKIALAAFDKISRGEA